jgi:2-polyprenyl-6-hydroxyphenyl methylase/3-demethylubiquinone-9 3-methyltransferase
MDGKNAQQLKQLYQGLGYVTAFVHWRCWHTPYDVIEPFIPREGVIVDLGCGYGLFANFLALTSRRRQIRGIDLSERKLKYADRGVPNVSFRKGDVLRCQWERCQAVALIHLLHHLSSFKEQEELLRACYERLDSDGVLLTLEVDNNPRWKFLCGQLVDTVAYLGDTFYYRTSSELTDVLRTIGFRDIEAVPVHKGVPLSHTVYVARK